VAGTICAVWISLLSQAGPVGYWKGDDGAAPATALDSSGNGNNGSYVNGATTSVTHPVLQFPDSHSFSFDGTNDYVNIPSFTWPAGGPVTVAFWNFVAAADVQQANAFSIGNQDNPNRFQAHVPYNDHFLSWDYGDWTGNGRVQVLYDPYLNKWTHVALVSEGNGGAFKAIYLDGALVASGNVSDGPDAPLTGATIGLWALFNNYHKGRIDDFRIYNRVLTAAQIQLLSGGSTEPAATTVTAAPGPGRIQLDWIALPGATSYNVKRSPTPGGPYVTIASVAPGASYLDATATPGVALFYVVSGVGVSEGPDSNEASAVALSGSPDLVIGGCGALGLELLAILGLIRFLARRQRA